MTNIALPPWIPLHMYSIILLHKKEKNLPSTKDYSMNKQSPYSVVDVLTTDTRSMSCEIGAHVENVERKCFTIRSASQSTTAHVDEKDVAKCQYVVVMNNHMAR